MTSHELRIGDITLIIALPDGVTRPDIQLNWHNTPATIASRIVDVAGGPANLDPIMPDTSWFTMRSEELKLLVFLADSPAKPKHDVNPDPLLASLERERKARIL